MNSGDSISPTYGLEFSDHTGYSAYEVWRLCRAYSKINSVGDEKYSVYSA